VLPTFVIGLREGLETVVILGAIALFLIHQDRRHQLRLVWMASAAAAALCLVVAIVLRLIEVSLSTLADDRFQAIVGAVAVLTVTYMVIWMRRFPKDLLHDSEETAARAFAGGSGRTLAVVAFFAVLREGFEISVFVLALIGAKTSSPALATIGAVAGVLVATVVGIAVVRGGIHVDIARFFRVTAFVLVLSAAGLVMTAVTAANAAGWLVFGQTPQFNWSHITPPGTVQSSIVTGMFGIQPYPVLLDVVLWLAYLIPMTLVVILPRGSSATKTSRIPTKTRRLLVVVSVGIIFVFASSELVLRSLLDDPTAAAAGTTTTVPSMPLPAQGLTNGSFLLLRNTQLGSNYGRVALVAADDPTGPRAWTPLSCNRVDFEGGVGLCLTRPATGLSIATSAIIFNAHFKVLHRVALSGLPSRARVSPDGRFGTVTNFVTGDSYATINAYSTRTDIIDMQTGQVVFDLDQLTITRHGQPFQAANFNFWGVTFANDGRHFYATLGSGNHTYLIKGDLETRRATVIMSNVECPSLSPDNRDIAFKRRLPGSVARWRISVLDLATLKVHPLAETRSIDDQVEWLNNTTVIYGLLQNKLIASLNPLSATTPNLAQGAQLVTNMWTVPADGSGTPHLFSSDAWSEVVTNR
jgi:high-affinity iron transporter